METILDKPPRLALDFPFAFVGLGLSPSDGAPFSDAT